MEAKVQTSDGEIHSLELELDENDTVNSLVSQVSACLASVSTGIISQDPFGLKVALMGAQWSP